MMGIDEGLHGQRDPVGAPTPRRRRLEHPGEWDRSAAIKEIKENHAAINQENGTTDALSTATILDWLAKDKASHDAKVAAYKKEKERREDEDAKLARDEEKAKAIAQNDELCTPFDADHTGRACSNVGELYFSYIMANTPNMSAEERVERWRKAFSGLLDRICPALGSPFTEKSDARVAHNKILVDMFYLAGPPIFERMIEHPSKERRSAADAFYLNMVTGILAILKGDNHLNAHHNYIAVANTAQVPKFVSGTPPAVHFARYKEYHNAVFAMAVAKYAKDSSAAKLASETKALVVHKTHKDVDHVAASVSKALKAPLAPNAK